MKKIEKTEKIEKEIEEKKKEFSRDWKILRRLRCIEMRMNKVKSKEIEKKLEISWDAITQWCKIYLEEWLDWLCKLKYEWRVKSQLDEYKEDILEKVNNNTYWSYKEFLSEVKTLSPKITIKLHWFIKYCKKNWIWLQNYVK